MNLKFLVSGLLLCAGMSQFISSCDLTEDEWLVEKHCGRCHLAPDPQLLPKDTWANDVLPRMSFYLQSRRDAPDHPLKMVSMEEQVVLNNRSLFPATDLVSQEEWDRLVKYYIDRAPAGQNQRPPISHSVQDLFKEHLIKEENGNPPMNSLVRIDGGNLWVGSGYGSLTSFQWEKSLINAEKHSGLSMPVDLMVRNDELFVLDIGLIMPNDRRMGKMIRLVEGEWHIQHDLLRRPVTMADLGDNSTAIGQFGHLAGAVSIGEEKNVRTDLIGQAGCVKLLSHDLDKDGRDELIGLFGQGDEGVIICSSCDEGWCCQKVLTLHPLFGSSDMELADIDGDGWTDIVLASGDNADYSIVDKDYHGVYFYRNQGSFTFEAYDFIPMHGSTNIEVMDFDQDGDVDVMATAFFPVFHEDGPGRAVVYFEQTDGHFVPKSIAQAKEGRWLVMDAGDLDDDGDVDVVIGSFSLHPSPVTEDLKNYWQRSGASLLILENQVNP